MKIPASAPVGKTDSYKQPQPLCVEVLTHYLLGWEGNSSLFSSHSAVFCLTEQGLEDYYFFSPLSSEMLDTDDCPELD